MSFPKPSGVSATSSSWLLERLPQGAAAWLDAYDQMVERLRAAADMLPVAQENNVLDLEVRQILFKTKRGPMVKVRSP